MPFDINEVGGLLQILDLVSKNPSLGAIQNATSARLHEINTKLRDEAKAAAAIPAGPAPTAGLTAEAPATLHELNAALPGLTKPGEPEPERRA